MKKANPELLKNLQPHEKQILEWLIKSVEKKSEVKNANRTKQKVLPQVSI